MHDLSNTRGMLSQPGVGDAVLEQHFNFYVYPAPLFCNTMNQMPNLFLLISDQMTSNF